MENLDIKCEVTFKEGNEPIKIKDEPVDKDSAVITNVKSEPPDLSKANPLMFQANQMFQQNVKLEPLEPSAFAEEYLENELKINQDRKIRSQQFSANGIEGVEVFSCKMCKANYVSKQMLENHIQQSHTTGTGWIHCQLCEYKFRKVNKFNEHMVACHGQFKKLNNSVPEEHSCALCDFRSTTSFTLVMHMQKVHAERPDANGQFSCENCPFKASTINAIKSHRYLTHFQKNLEDVGFDLSKLVSCVVCSTQMPNKELLKKHLQEKHNMSAERDVASKPAVKKFNCAHCDLSFQYWSKLETHENTKHPDKDSQIENMYKCKKCNFKPMTVFALEVHNDQAHPSDISFGGTNIRETLTAKKASFSSRPQVVPSQMKFSNVGTTEVADGQPPLKKIKVNDLSAELSKHRSIKAGDIKLSSKQKEDTSPLLLCTICSFKTFKEIFFLNHMHKVHNRFGDLEQVKRYSCRKCDGLFDSLLLFVAHKGKCKPVKGPEPLKKTKAFRCAICNERFLESSIMQNHVNSHTVIGPEGIKRYKCPDCEHIYKNPRLLVEHIQNNHKAENKKDNDPLETAQPVINNESKDPLGAIDPTVYSASNAVKKHAADQLNIIQCKEKKGDSFEDDPEIKELDDILNSFNNENEDFNKSKERNKANIDSDDDGSDTSVDSDDEDVKPKGKKASYSCLYCQEGPKTTFQSKDALMNHQKDIFGLRKSDKFFVRSHLNCPHCTYMIQCEVSMSKHLRDVHQISDKKCDNCTFKSNMDAIMSHHVTNNHKNTASLRTCAVCGIVLRDKKNLAGHYFSKHNILDPSKLKTLQKSC